MFYIYNLWLSLVFSPGMGYVDVISKNFRQKEESVSNFLKLSSSLKKTINWLITVLLSEVGGIETLKQ